MNTINSLITSTLGSLYNSDYTPEISVAPKPELGEYCINVFPLAKTAGKAPNLISEEVATELAKHTDVFVSTSATGGYVNFFLTDAVWLNLFASSKNESPKTKNWETIVVDYIGANVGKPLHIGHICTPSIGQVICNTYRHLGYNVIGDSHFGDWGGIFGKIIYAWNYLITTEDFLNYKNEIVGKNYDEIKAWRNNKLKESGISFLLELYQAFHEILNTPVQNIHTKPQLEFWEIIKSEENKRELWARLEFQYLSWVGIDLSNPEELKHHEENVELWKRFTSISIAETEKKLDLLNVHATYNIGESFYEWLGLPRPNGEDYPDLEFNMKSIVAELIEKWVATQNEDGSVGVVFSEESKIPSCILQKKDGTWLYLTSDLAAIKYRLTNGWNPTKLIYSVDVRQQLHLKQAFNIARMAWPELTEWVELFHAFNGFIKLKEGAMSTRHGTVIFLEKLIEEGNERTEKILEEKWRTWDKALKDRKDIEAITVGAIKYSYLAQDREKDVTFDWDKALAFEGNSGPYIQYAYVRARKISESGGIRHPELAKDPGNQEHGFFVPQNDAKLELSSYDKSLIQSLALFPDAVDTTAKTYKPHHIALYAYSLAVTFNGFYVHTPKILEEENTTLRDFRLTLVHETAETLKKAFDLLGIEMPSEM